MTEKHHPSHKTAFLIFKKNRSYLETCPPKYSENGQYVLIKVYAPEFVGVLAIDVVNESYAGIKYPHFEFCSVSVTDDEVIVSNAERDHKHLINEKMQLSSLNCHHIDEPDVDYIPTFEMYW